MKRLEYDKTGNKPVGVETGCTPFDKQTNYLGNGNVIARTMVGWRIRPHSDIMLTPDVAVEPGILRRIDLHPIIKKAPKEMVAFIKQQDVVKPLWVYWFFHTASNTLVPHGYVIADENDNHIKTFIVGDEKVVTFARDYVCNVN